MKRRDFLKTSVVAGGGALLYGCSGFGPATRSTTQAAATGVATTPDAALKALADVALEAARAAGASYADIRINDYQRQVVASRENRITRVSDEEDRGFGVRVIADGTWGFAASSRIDREEIARIARKAVAVAKGNASLQKEPVRLAAIGGPYVAAWATPIRRDPFTVPLAEKTQRLLEINAEALKLEGVNFCTSSMAFAKEHKFFASTDGSYIEQTIHRCNPNFNVTSAVKGVPESRNSYTDPQGVGYEYVEDYPWLEDARQAAADVIAKRSAPSVEPGKWDLILHPSHLWLTIHESVGHPTELDRALGLEANYAGTSFLTPDKLGSFKFGSDIVNFRADKTQKTGLATCGYDDDGAPTTEWDLVKDGVFVEYQITRDQAHLIGRDRSYACSYAQSWKDLPFQRMPNVSLLPGKKSLTLANLIADTERAILIQGRGSYSIDHQRYNFQFGGQTFWKVENGRIAGMLRDVAYQARTPDFWNSCDAICSQDEYAIGGSFNDGKGEPGQSNAVSHGCAPARFRQINVLNTARKV